MPEENELVVCTVDKVTEFAAWCTLDEYSLKGIIHVSEVAGKWVRDIRQYVKAGKKYVCRVMKVEPEVVTLSLRRVSREEAKERANQFRKEERAEKILELAAKSLGKSLDEAYEEVGFTLQEKFGDLYTAIESLLSPKKVQKLNISKQWLDALTEAAKKSIRQKTTELKYELEIYSYAPNGIELIKKLIKEIEDSLKTKVKYLSAPVYRLSIETTQPREAEKKITAQLEKLKARSDVVFSYRRIE